MIPRHKIYCEPFFGGGAVFFAKKKSYLEVINDRDDRLITFYEVCRDPELFPFLLAKIQATLHSEKEYITAKKIWNQPGIFREGKVGLAWAVWLCTNMSFNGTPQGGWKWDNGTCRSHSGNVMEHYRQQFSRQIHDRLKNVQLSCRDALVVIKQRDTVDTFFYLDPPYPNTCQAHYGGYSEDDLEQLLKMLSGIEGKFLLSNFSSEILEYYILKNGWEKRTIDMTKQVTHHINSKGRKQELLVYNYDLPIDIYQLFNAI